MKSVESRKDILSYKSYRAKKSNITNTGTGTVPVIC